MLRKNLVVTGLAAFVGLTLACSETPSVTSPTGSASSSTNAVAGSKVGTTAAGAADGSTLKVTPPVPQSPINDQRLGDSGTLVAAPSTVKFANAALQYRFEIFNPAGALVDSAVMGGPSYKIAGTLDMDTRHSWRVRAEYQGAFGPWSAPASFLTPEGGFLRSNELYDPLINGKTVGVIHGPVTFIPGVGAKLEDFSSYISYQLPQTLVEGEFSILVTNLRTRHEGSKTKILAMSQGYDDIVTNDRRMTLEKRSDGTVAWRFITHDDQIDTGSNERQVVQFNLTDTFFFGTSWRNNRFDVNVRRGGSSGAVMYDLAKNWNGHPYDPTPHVLFVGSPSGRSGLDSATVPGMIVRQVWASSRPRPASAN
jgi:hypothetical protein